MDKHRVCATCKTPTMILRSRELAPYNSVGRYACDTCEETVSLVPTASIGVSITVGGLALGFWWIVLNHGAGSPSTLALVMMGIAGLAYTWVWLPQVVKHWLYPVAHEVETDAAEEIRIDGSKHLFQRQISFVERLGMFGGLLAPIIFIGVVLGAAALIGFINFTYFE